MIEKYHPSLSIGAQCRLLSIPRSSFCDAPPGETAMNLALMRLIDRQFLETPLYGLRQMTWQMRSEGAERGACREPQAHSSTDAAHGAGGPWRGGASPRNDAGRPEARHQQARQGAQDLPLSAGRSARGSMNASTCTPGKQDRRQGRHRALDHRRQPPTATHGPRTKALRGIGAFG
jgi:hypothetical protein